MPARHEDVAQHSGARSLQRRGGRTRARDSIQKILAAFASGSAAWHMACIAARGHGLPATGHFDNAERSPVGGLRRCAAGPNAWMRTYPLVPGSLSRHRFRGWIDEERRAAVSHFGEGLNKCHALLHERRGCRTVHARSAHKIRSARLPAGHKLVAASRLRRLPRFRRPSVHRPLLGQPRTRPRL